MTENKRYTLEEFGLNFIVKENGEDLTAKQTVERLNVLNDENKELQERNDRQAKRLKELYKLIEKEDYTQLQNIIQDFKDCEEQLSKEWGYCSE